MHVISKTLLKQFWEKHPNAESGLKSWYKIASQSQWKHLEDVRQTFPHADAVGQLTVFNICGNNYRLIAKIVFPKGKVYIRAMLTHAEYSKGNWKKDTWF
ncbi:MAG: type II toxin-antitoxin system HigB family toxin [Planktothrix agardhii]|jgi:mRNA interferase HigB|uniref:type II toxin-antitoxin system HigB family toxin n=1 Tax=Planktothrix agardhii TaxID=1160 RepID=UPI003C388C0A